MSTETVSVENDPQHLLSASNDPMSMNRLGRLYARDNNLQALEVAAMNISTCDENTITSFRWWWNEGIRDYAGNENRVAKLNQDLIDAVEKIS